MVNGADGKRLDANGRCRRVVTCSDDARAQQTPAKRSARRQPHLQFSHHTQTPAVRPRERSPDLSRPDRT